MMKVIEIVAYLLLVTAAVIYLFLPQVAPWLMMLGGLGVVATHLTERYGGKSLRKRRRMKLRWLLGLFYCVSAYYMFRPGMDWLPWLCIAVVLELYTLFVISKRETE